MSILAPSATFCERAFRLPEQRAGPQATPFPSAGLNRDRRGASRGDASRRLSMTGCRGRTRATAQQRAIRISIAAFEGRPRGTIAG